MTKITSWVSLFIDRNLALYFDSFGIDHIPQILNKKHIFRIQVNESVLCEFCWIVFIEYMLGEITFLHYSNIFSPNDYKKKAKIIYQVF